MRKMKNEKGKKPRFYEQTNFFLSTMTFSPWVVLATWLYVGAPQKIHEN
jgi:hypothetical protein